METVRKKKAQSGFCTRWGISMLMVLVLCLTVFAVPAFAEDVGGEVLTAETDGGEVLPDAIGDGEDAEPAMAFASAPLAASQETDEDTGIEVELVTASETVKAATAELSPEGGGISGNLQAAIDAAVSRAQEDGDSIVTVNLTKDTVYSGKVSDLNTRDDSFEKFVFTCEDGTATINSEITINEEILVEIINILFGNDCILSVKNDGQLTIGSEEDRFTGEVRVIAGERVDDEDSDDGYYISPGQVTVYAGDGASVIAEVNSGEDASTVTVSNTAGDSAVFTGQSNVGIVSGETADTRKSCTAVISSEEKVTVNYINAWDADVVINAPVVTVNKADAATVRWLRRFTGNQSRSFDLNELRSFKIIAASENSKIFDLTDTLDLSDILAELGITDVFSVASPVNEAEVKINAGITALKDITVYSYTTQTENLVNSFVNLGMNVKIGSATIDLAEGVVLTAGEDITLKATTRSSAGYDENGQADGSVLPFAFNIFVENASVNLNHATLNAGGNVTADALGTIAANASCSFGPLFVGVAFNVIINDAAVEAIGTTVKAGGNVELLSRADTTAVAAAERRATNESRDGLYFATNVVIQNSKANVGSGTHIDAKGDVNIRSSSDVDATDDAIASPGTPDEDASALPFMGALKTIGWRILGRVFDKVGGWFTFSAGDFEKALAFFKTDGYSIEIDSAAQEKGTVKAGTDSNNKLVIAVDSRYEVEQVLIRYLPVGSDAYHFVRAEKNPSTGKFELDIASVAQPVTLEQFRVYVFYSDQMNSEVEMQEMPAEEDDGFSLADLFDSAVESAADDSDADPDCGGNIILNYIYKLDGKEVSDKGTVVTDAMSADVTKGMTQISALLGVAEEKNVRFNPNCAVGYQVKSMMASYTDTNGEKKEVAIEKNNAGHYVFAVPSGIKDSSLTVTTEFEPKNGEESKDKPSQNQITGSLGVGVIVNHNDALVDLGTGTIVADGKVNVDAEATSNIAGKADGTAVTEASILKGKTSKQTAEDEALSVTDIPVTENGKETDTVLYVYGRSSGDVTATLNGTVYTVTLAPDADFGFKLPDYITIIVLGEDNREHAVQVTGKDGKYTVDIGFIDYKNDVISEARPEDDFAVRSIKLTAIYASNIYKVDRELLINGKITVDRYTTRGMDTITVKPMPNDGCTLNSIALRYRKDGKLYTIDFVPSIDGFYTCTLPRDSELATWEKDEKGCSMTVYALFDELGEAAEHTIQVDGSVSSNITVDKTKAYCGEKVTIKRTETGKNYRINADKIKVTYLSSSGVEIEIKIDPTDLSFVIPVEDAIAVGAVITVNAEEGYPTAMNVPLAVSTDIQNGKVSIESQKDKTGSGDVFFVNVTSDVGYILKLGSLRAEYDKGGSEVIRLGAPVKVADGLYKFVVPETVGNSAGQITVSAEFTKGENSSSSTGIAVAVDVGLHRNNARITSGSITAVKGVSVTAVTNGKAVTEALAGYSSATTGIAGAIAVDVANFRTYAVIGKGVSLNAGERAESESHELSVNAEANISSFRTNANAYMISEIPGMTPSAEKLGVGTGIAVAVNGVETVASVNDGVVYDYARPLDRASASASNTLKSDEVSAKSGAMAKKTAVTPVVGLNIIDCGAKAYIGTFADGKALTARLVELTANSSSAHKMNVDATSIGGASAMAGSFGINIIDDAARAILNSDIGGYGSDVSVSAQSVSTLETTVKASSMGSKPGTKKADDSKGSADQKADSIINSGEKLGAKAGMGAPTADLTKNRQQAQTAEGSIAGAAAFALNIQSNESEAAIEDGAALGSSTTRLGDVRVAARGMTSADIMADGSATSLYTGAENKTGIGVAVAINIVSADNSAYIGEGFLHAGNVSVTAGPAADEKGGKQASVFTTSAVSGASASGVGIAGSVALAVLNNTTSARISKAQSDIYYAASTTIRAEDLRIADTTASAAKSEKGRPNKNLSKIDTEKPADADMSNSVGAGASFAMVYGDHVVLAEFIAPAAVNDNSNTGVFLCEAVSDHSEESTAVAGTDPYKTLCDPLNFKFSGKSSAIALDAAVAVNAVHSAITAQLAADGYTPTINAGSVRLNAVERGHSKTDSSGFAMGQNTAVGGSVAVNLNISSVRASNGCFLKVSGDDQSADDGEDHQRSVEITASSEVTEENNAYAMAAGGDIIRYVEKYKSLLSQIDIYKQYVDRIEVKAEELTQIIRGFLDGTYFERIEASYDEAVDAYRALYDQIKAEIARDGKSSTSLKDTAEMAANSGNALSQSIMSFIASAKRIGTLGSQVHSLSSTLLKLLNVGTPSTQKMDGTTDKATGEANKGISGSSGQQSQLDNNGKADKDAESMQIAAAVGVSISDHELLAENRGEIQTKGGVHISADARVDAIAHAIGFAASTNGGVGSIALAIAVKVDNNTVRAFSEESITVGSGRDVIISASLSENTRDKTQSGTDTDFTSAIGTEAVAGAVSGGAKVAISGAIVVFVSSSETMAELADNAVIEAVNHGRAGDVRILAGEIARQTMRTVALSGSKANLTMGISAGVLVTENVTRARAGKNVNIKAKNIAVEAQRKSVSLDNDTGLSVETAEGSVDFGSEESSAEGESEEAGTTGVDIKDSDGESILVIDTDKATENGEKENSTLSVGLNQERAKELLENALNVFAEVDYYIAVDSGAIAVGSAKSSSGGVGSIAGSVAAVTVSNTVEAIVDEGAVLDSSEDISVAAASAEQTRLISGAISASPSGSKATVGAVIAFLYEKNTINALVKNGSLLTAGKDIFVIGRNTGRSEAYTVTASGSAGSTATVAATIDVILSEASVNVQLAVPGGNMAHTAQAVTVLAENSKALRNITVSLAASGGAGTAQAGGAVAVIAENSSAIVNARGTKIVAAGKPIAFTEKDRTPYALDSIVIRADNTHDMFVIVASASVASGSTANVAGVVSVILDESHAEAYTSGSVFRSNTNNSSTQRAGNVIIAAQNESDLLNVNVQASLGGTSTAAVGAAVTVNILKRQVINEVSTAEAPTVIELYNGDVSLTADAKDRVIVVAAGANGSAANMSVQGTILVVVENNTASLTAQKITLSAPSLGTSVNCGETTVRAGFAGELYGVAGGINFTSGSTAAGATIVVAVSDNITSVDITDSSIVSAERIDVLSAADTRTLLISIGAAVANAVAVEGSVVTVVASDTVSIHLGKTSIESGSVRISALGRSSETYISGALAGSGSVSVGPSVLVFTKERNVLIDSAPGGMIGGANGCNVSVLASTVDDIFTLVLAMSASGTTAVSAGICTEVIRNTVTCDIDADINAGGYVIDIGARSDRHLANYLFGGGFTGTASVVPVATVIYLTDKVTCDVSGILRGHTVNVLADTDFELLEIAMGAAGAGTAGISGTFAVVVNASDTRAIFSGAHTGKTKAAAEDSSSLNVLANDNYRFLSVMANVAGGGTAAVGVTAAVTVVRNNVLASVGDAEKKKTINADYVNVSAIANREIKNVVGSLAFGGTAGASVNVAVVVAGSKLPQDAYDMLTKRTEDGKTSTTFDSETLLSAIRSANVYAADNGCLDEVTLASDLQGNGKRDSQTGVCNVDGQPFVEGLADADTAKDYSGSEAGAVEADTLRGEDSTIDPGTDASVIANADAGKNVVYSYDGAGIAAVQALVRNVVINCKELSITARDTQSAEIDSVNGAVGGTAAASVGVSVLVLHANVIAELDRSADVTCRTLTIHACSDSGDGSIRVIGGVASAAGAAGVGVAVAVVHLDNFTMASLAGNVTAAPADGSGIIDTVSVMADSNYKDVLAETVAVGAGGVGISASVAVVSLNGEIHSVISGNILSHRSASGNVDAGFGTVNCLVFFNNSVTARAACLGAGAFGGALGAAIASETLTVSAGIENGARVELDSINTNLRPVLRVLVAGSYDEKLNQTSQGSVQGLAQIASVSAGAVAAGFSVAVAYIRPEISSCINGTVSSTLGHAEITVGNDIYTRAVTGLFSATAGEGAFGANVLVSFNSTKSVSSVSGKITADTLTVMSLLSADAVSNMQGIQAAGTAIGVSTVLSILEAENEAAVGTGAEIAVGTLHVLAGATAPGNYQAGANFFSEAQLFSGSVAGYAVQLNVAVAWNKAVNRAALHTDGNVRADTVNVFAYSNPTASAATNKYTAELAGVGGSAAASTLSFTQLVEIGCHDLAGLENGLTTVNAGSYMYPGEARDPEGKEFKRDYAQASASVDIFEIAGLSINANVSYAKNTTVSRVIASFGTKIGNVTLDNNGSANAMAKLAEVGGNIVGIGANVVLSYVQAGFVTELNTNGVEGDVRLTTDYVSNAQASAKAASASLAGLQANVVVAKSTTAAVTLFNGGDRDVKTKTVSVRTIGDSMTQAEVNKPADVSVAVVAIGANIIESVLKTTQTARLENVRFVGTPVVLVSSVLNAGTDSKEHSAQARFEGAPDAVRVTLGELHANVILAKNYAENLASLCNVTSSDKISQITVSAENQSNAFADAGSAEDGNGFDAALVSVGVVVTIAENSGKNHAEAEALSANVGELDVTASAWDASAESYGGTSSQGVVAVADIAVNVSEAFNNAENTALIKNSRGAIDRVVVKAEAENVHAKARIGSAELSIAGVKAAANVVTATNNYRGSALIEDSELRGSSVDVSSLENRHFFETDKYSDVTGADVGSAGGKEISFISGAVNKAMAENTSEVKAGISGSVLTDYAVSVLADGRADVSSNIASPSRYGLLNVAVIKTEAKANGTVLAEFAPSDTQSDIASLHVKALGAARAEAVTGTAGSLAGAVSVESNTADADVQMLVKAAVSGGKLRVRGDADVSSLASSMSTAEAQTPGFVISALRIGINEVNASGAVRVEADVQPGDYTIGGKLSVEARIPTADELKDTVDNTKIYFDESTTTSTVRPSAGDDAGKKTTAVTLLGGNNHISRALSEHAVIINIGNIVNAGRLTADSVRINAVGNAKTTAKALDVDYTYGIATIGGFEANAMERDITQININTENLSVNGTLEVSARNDSAELNSVGTTPGGFSVVDVAKTEMNADLDNIARIKVNDHALVQAGSISFRAGNNGNSETSLTENASKSGLATVTNASAPVSERFTTEILFGTGSTVQTDGELRLVTDTYGESYSNVSQSIGGAAFDAAKLRGTSTVTSKNRIQIGADALVTAKSRDIVADMSNRGYLRSRSDYNSSFSLIGTSKIRADVNYTAENIFDMASGSSVTAESGNVEINQSNSDIQIDCFSSSIERAGIGVGNAGGTNTVVADNILNFADIRAEKGISVTQYGGAESAEAYGQIFDSGLGGTCEANGINDFTIRNRVNALDGGNLNAAALAIVQGADKLGFNSGARGFGEGLVFVIDGSAENNIRIQNELTGGTEEIGAGAGVNRYYVSNTDASGEIVSEMRSGSSFVKFGDTSAKNTLTVSTEIGRKYSPLLQMMNSGEQTEQKNGLKVYQNKFNSDRIYGKGSSDGYSEKVSYSPDGIKSYGFQSRFGSSTSNNFTKIILERLIEAASNDRGIGDGLQFHLDENGFLIIKNSALFAADLAQMDADWLYGFLTAGNIRWMVSLHAITASDLTITLSELINRSITVENVVITGNTITFTLLYEDEMHTFEIVFDRVSGTVSSYCLDDDSKIPVTLFVIESDGVMNVIVFHEDIHTKEAFILIPALVDGKLPVIKVRVKEEFLNAILSRDIP